MIRNNSSKKGGRPAKSQTEKRKYRLSLKLNTSEHLELKSKAHIAGKNRCDLIRELILTGKVNQRFSNEQIETMRHLSSMGNNLNQLVHKAHIQGVWYIETAGQKLITDIHELIKQIKV